MLSPQIGNGAAFLATVSGLFQADEDLLPSMAVLAWSPAMSFALGVTAAGVLPLLMFWQQSFPERPKLKRAAHVAALWGTTSSMGFFALGAGSVVEITPLREPALAAARSNQIPGCGPSPQV